MKIIHVVTLAELGGAQSVLLSLANEAHSQGHEVMVASSVSGELWGALPKGIAQWKIRSLKRKIHFVNDLQVVLELRKINRRFCPDVVHLHSSKIGILGRLAFSASKIVYTVHGFDSIRIAFRQFLRLERALQDRLKYIVGVSKYDQINLAAEGIVRNATCIYNGVADFYQMDENCKQKCLTAAKEQILSKQGFKILCIARISPQKKFDLFCEVAKQMKNHPVQFFWAGNKNEVADLPENVQCLGQVEDAHFLLRYVDLFMLPTNYEGMPVSIIESLCYAVPVIASNVGGISEMLNGCNGQALENEPDPFITAILKYSQNKNFLAASRLAARKSYEDLFTVQKMFAAYMELYESISQKPSRALETETNDHVVN